MNSGSRRPFTSLLIKFHHKTNFHQFKDTFNELTLLHTNYCFSENDKNKSIIHYRHPYDIACLIDKYENNANFNISIFYNPLSLTLRPDILFIETKSISIIENIIKPFDGKIILLSPTNMQVQFKNFLLCASAFNEIQQYYNVKFAVEDKVPKQEFKFETVKITDPASIVHSFQFKKWTLAQQAKFKETFEQYSNEKLHREQMLTLVQKFANERIDKSTDGSDDSDTPSKEKEKPNQKIIHKIKNNITHNRI